MGRRIIGYESWCVMIVGLGSDIVENERIEELYNKHKEKFLKRIFTKNEIDYALGHSNPIPYLASRFAVKEATVKALNLQGFSGFSWKDIEVCGKNFGKKTLSFHRKALELTREKKVTNQQISLSHCDHFSMAVVILESE